MAEFNSKQDAEILADQSQVAAENEYLRLRQLLLGPDYEQAIHDYISREDDLERVSDVLSEAVKLCTKDDPELGRALAPVLNKAIHESITNNPTQITNAISPIMGPAIRKAVSATLVDMVQGLNKVLEQSLSVQGLKWRIKAWRAGVSYGRYVMSQTLKYKVEQVLLVHRETGLLLHSVVDDQSNAQDPELVSSMLTAIQDFVTDSFDTQAESQLDRIQMGDLTLHLISGPFSVLAVAVRGNISPEALETVTTNFESIQRRYAPELESFDGNRDAFLATEDDLRVCLVSEKIEAEEKARKIPWLAVAVLTALGSYGLYQAYWSYQINEERLAIQQSLETEAGYVLLSHKTENGHFHAQLFRSPESISPNALSTKISPTHYQLDLEVKEVTFGFVDVDKLDALAVPQPKSLIEQYQEEAARVQATHLLFEANSARLLPESQSALNELVANLNAVIATAKALNAGELQVMVMGFADDHGSRYGNLNVSQQRADLVKDILVQNGVAQGVIVAWGLGHRDGDLSTEALKRRVSFQLLLPGIDHVDKAPAKALDRDAISAEG